MAGFKIMEKLAESSGELLGRARNGIAGKEGQGENKNTLGSVRKQLEELINEKSKLYGIIGMEACDLHGLGKLESRELELYFEKMRALTEQMEQLEEEKKELEARGQKNNTCECGCKLSKHDKFCPSCGRRIDTGTILCTCGTELKTTLKFCPNCGVAVSELLQGQQAAEENVEEDRVCICGAKIRPGQFMCMECGRRIEA